MRWTVSFLLCSAFFFGGCGKGEEKETALPDKETALRDVEQAVEESAVKTEPDASVAPERGRTVEGFGDEPQDVVPKADAKAVQISIDGLLKYLMAARTDRDRLPMALMALEPTDQERVREANLDAKGMLALLGVPNLKANEYSVGAASRAGERFKADVTMIESGKPVHRQFYLTRSGFQWQVELFLSALGGTAAVPNSTYSLLEQAMDKALLGSCIAVLLAADEPEAMGGFERALIIGASKVGDEDAAAQMRRRLDRVPVFVKGMFMKALARIGGTESLQKVVSLIQAADEETRVAAFEALRAWNGEEAAAPLMKLAREDEGRRDEALKGYVGLASRLAAGNPDKALTLYRQAFEATESDDLKINIVAGLGDVHSVAALQEARRHLDNEPLAGTAARSTARIAGSIWRDHEPEALDALNTLAKESKDNRLVRDVNNTLAAIEKAKKEQADKK